MADFWKGVAKKLTKDIAIDLGASCVRVYVEGEYRNPEEGILVEEPSMVAVNKDTRRVECIGAEARNMIGRVPRHIELIRPTTNLSVFEKEIVLEMLQYYIRKACDKTWLPPRVVITTPTATSNLGKEALMDAAREAGARRTYLLEEIQAAALGAGVDYLSPNGVVVVNIGSCVTEAALFASGGIVRSETIPVGGDDFDYAIMDYIYEEYGIQINKTSAEEVKRLIGNAFPQNESAWAKISGSSREDGLRREDFIYSRETLGAMYQPIEAILRLIDDMINFMIDATQP